MITITDIATQRIHGYLEAEGRPNLALRFGVQGRGPGGFLYRLAFVEAQDRVPSDTVVEAGPFQVFIDAGSVPQLTGATIDFVDGERESGFRIENPNPLWADPIASAVQKVLDQEINPAVDAHGGWVTLLDVKDSVAYVQFGGGCQGCGMADVTLKQGVDVRIKELVPQIRAVVDTTDHAGGTNPYYQGAAHGASPVA